MNRSKVVTLAIEGVSSVCVLWRMAGMVETLAEKDAKKTFAQLKPVCVDVLRSLSVENLGRLAEALRHQHHLTSPLVEYVLFPLRLGVRRLGG